MLIPSPFLFWVCSRKNPVAAMERKKVVTALNKNKIIVKFCFPLNAHKYGKVYASFFPVQMYGIYRSKHCGIKVVHWNERKKPYGRHIRNITSFELNTVTVSEQKKTGVCLVVFVDSWVFYEACSGNSRDMGMMHCLQVTTYNELTIQYILR